jgi:DNA-binding CsgD family transcriptional regulator/pSer/pThr/pTyr-binding forkhead associated (FHA) protein
MDKPSDDDLVPCIEVLEGRSQGKSYVLDRVRGYVVGRLSGAEIPIDDPGVSRRHVKLLRRADGSVAAVDMRSTNGLILNGERVEAGLLREGDLINLGPDAVLRLCYLEPSQLAARAAGGERRPRESAEGPMPSSVSNEALEPTEPIEPSESATSEAIVIHRPRLEDLPLSARQLEVSRLVADGLTNAAIGEQLGISTRTVTSHLDHIYVRLEINSRAALTRWIVERGLT